MLGAIEELRAKPIWSAAQRAQLAALSERLRTATVAGETEQLRELLPQASGEVNALILAAQAAAQRRAAVARYVPAPNAGTGGMDLASVGGMDLGTADLPREISSRPQTLFGRLARTFSYVARQAKHVFQSAIHAVQKVSQLVRSVLNSVQRIATTSTHTAPKGRMNTSRHEYADHLYTKLFPNGPNDPPCPPGWQWVPGSQPCGDHHGNPTTSTIRCKKGVAGPEMCAQQAWEDYWRYEGQFRLAKAFVSSRAPNLYPALLAASAHESYSAHINQSDHPVLLLENTLRWEEEHRADIRQTAATFGIPPELLAGVLMTEMYWDYGHTDELMDHMAPLVGRIGGIVNRFFLRKSAPGLASVHFDTYKKAYEDLEIQGKLPPDVIPPDALNAEYLVTPEGTIQAAALVTLWLVEQYDHNTLSTEDMALIYAAYRQSTVKIADPDNGVTFQNWLDNPSRSLPGNGQFALPFMQYATEVY